MKFAGHVHRDTHGKSYAHPLSDVDGPATYLGIASRHGHIQNRRGMGIHRNANLWQTLPAKAEFELEERDDIACLTTEIAELSLKIATVENPEEKRKIELEHRRAQNKKRQLYMEELRRQQKKQPSKSQAVIGSDQVRLHFQYTRRVMPERDILARLLPKCDELRSKDGREAIRAMESICKQESTIAYRPSLRPIGGKCICGTVIDTYVKGLHMFTTVTDFISLHHHRRWLHLYRCYCKRARQMGTSDFAELCFECDLWCTDRAEWEQHCQEHLDKPEELLRCDPLMFRNAPVKAGYCPFCLGNTDLQPQQRMRQFIIDRSEWYNHIESHFQEFEDECGCSHPACQTQYDNLGDLHYHLWDCHYYRPLRGQKRGQEEIS
jgi:hypothetical protein